MAMSGPGLARAAPEGTLTWGAHVSLAARWLDPADAEGTVIPFMLLYAVHDALVKPMPAGLYTPSLAESWTMSTGRSGGRHWRVKIPKRSPFTSPSPLRR